MKKILIAAVAVGTAASLVMLYLQKRRQGGNLLDDAKDAVDRSTRRMRKYMRQTKDKTDHIYSNAMG
ncbi:hypothetical protein ACDQ55_15315 [Chitinophaga sp. 30R24]|uniref:hypothetical protein n=1 Tax=Chitinophaga sp. 30R24 TaxID=3248838 RepID=UPI003B8FB1B0